MEKIPVNDKSLFFLCRMCHRMAKAVENGETMCPFKCGGPKKGKTFPLYDGPMTQMYLEMHCFVCGCPAERYVEVDGGTRKLGVCTSHMRFAVPEELLKAEDRPKEATDIGLIVATHREEIPLAEALGIDPKELGFEEKKT